jgi:hypothetical protein
MMVKCAACGVPIRSLWAPGNRGLLPGNYVLVADWLFHPGCFDSFFDDGPDVDRIKDETVAKKSTGEEKVEGKQGL